MEARERPQDWTIELLLSATETAPAVLLEELMADSRCPAFGPIHHILVGAALLAAWRNAEGSPDRGAVLRADLEELVTRSGCVPGATCARWGVCGAAASAGIGSERDSAPWRPAGGRPPRVIVRTKHHTTI